jgi:MFS family permease
MAGVAEVFLPAFGLALGLSAVFSGLLASVPLVAGGVLQLFSPRAMQRVTSLRGWVVACTAIQALAFLPLIVLALTRTPSAPLLFAAASIYWAAGMAGAAGWTPWMARVVPERVRSRFFARRMGLAQGSMLVGLMAAGLALHGVAPGRLLDVYAGMFGLALLARLGSTIALAYQGRGVDTAPRRRLPLRGIAARLRGSPRGPLLLYLIAALAAAAIGGPFITPYLLDHHRLSYVEYSAFTATIVIVKIAALPVVGRVLGRVGLRKVLTVSALAIVPIPLLWLVSDAVAWFLVIQVYAGIAWAGFELGMLMALLDAGDDAERTTMQVAFSALQALGTAGASVIGGALLGALGTDHAAYLWVFAVSAAARFLAAMLLVRRLPREVVRLPLSMVARMWTLAIRPWGGTIVRPLVEGLSRLRRDRDP